MNDLSSTFQNDQGYPVGVGEQGILVIKGPWPGMARTIYQDNERYKNVYWDDYEKQGWYEAGDSARKDSHGYI